MRSSGQGQACILEGLNGDFVKPCAPVGVRRRRSVSLYAAPHAQMAFQYDQEDLKRGEHYSHRNAYGLALGVKGISQVLPLRKPFPSNARLFLVACSTTQV